MRRAHTYTLPGEIIDEIARRSAALEVSASSLAAAMLKVGSGVEDSTLKVLAGEGKLKPGPKTHAINRTGQLILDTMRHLNAQLGRQYLTDREIYRAAPATKGVTLRTLKELALRKEIADEGMIANPDPNDNAVGAPMEVRVYRLLKP
jgi:hypothetical protein